MVEHTEAHTLMRLEMGRCPLKRQRHPGVDCLHFSCLKGMTGRPALDCFLFFFF